MYQGTKLYDFFLFQPGECIHEAKDQYEMSSCFTEIRYCATYQCLNHLIKIASKTAFLWSLNQSVQNPEHFVELKNKSGFMYTIKLRGRGFLTNCKKNLEFISGVLNLLVGSNIINYNYVLLIQVKV